jgi:hypothetical protein
MRVPTLSLAALLMACTPYTTAFPFSWANLSESKSGFIANEVNVLAPTIVGIYFCTDADWKGHCEHLKNGPAICSAYKSDDQT